MELTKIENRHLGKYLNYYDLHYVNNEGKEKVYEITSRNTLKTPSDLGAKVIGITIIGFSGDRLLLLREFRMSINRYVYGLCSGMPEPGETPEECAQRELMEETGLHIEKILKVMPPGFASVGISDGLLITIVAEVSGDLVESHRANEDIIAGLYTKEEVIKLMDTEDFTANAQRIAWMFACR